MNSPNTERRVVIAGTGQEVGLRSSDLLGSGGEGAVYAAPFDSGLAAKIYTRTPADIGVKLGLMVSNRPNVPIDEEDRISISWPEDLLYEPGSYNMVAGFLMRRVEGRPANTYYSPTLRQREASHFNYEYLLTAARNIARAVDIFHGNRFVIGDINESNIYIEDSASIALIDTDSFQVTDRQNARIYRSPVGKPEYTPPELQGHRFDSVDRTSDHDLFGLGVIIFQMLMEGVHPFDGRYAGQGDPPQREERIADGHFVYSRSRRVPYTPPPTSPSWDALHPDLRERFIQCFDTGHDDPRNRPTATEWVETIENAVWSLTTCNRNSQHKSFNHLPACPWCDRAGRLGKDPYPDRLFGSGGLKSIGPPPPNAPAVQQPGPPPAQQPAYPAAQQPGYTPVQQPTYPAVQQPGAPPVQQSRRSAIRRGAARTGIALSWAFNLTLRVSRMFWAKPWAVTGAGFLIFVIAMNFALRQHPISTVVTAVGTIGMAVGYGLRRDEPALGWSLITLSSLIGVVGFIFMLSFVPLPAFVALGGGVVTWVGFVKVGRRGWSGRR